VRNEKPVHLTHEIRMLEHQLREALPWER
jgi:hypothetical protein